MYGTDAIAHLASGTFQVLASQQQQLQTAGLPQPQVRIQPCAAPTSSKHIKVEVDTHHSLQAGTQVAVCGNADAALCYDCWGAAVAKQHLECWRAFNLTSCTSNLNIVVYQQACRSLVKCCTMRHVTPHVIHTTNNSRKHMQLQRMTATYCDQRRAIIAKRER